MQKAGETSGGMSYTRNLQVLEFMTSLTESFARTCVLAEKFKRGNSLTDVAQWH